MKVVVTPRAEADVAAQYEWGRDRFGASTADRTFLRVRRFIESGLARQPRPRRQLPVYGLFEAWIPDTPFIVYFRVDEDADTVWVLALFHSSQGRAVSDVIDPE